MFSSEMLITILLNYGTEIKILMVKEVVKVAMEQWIKIVKYVLIKDDNKNFIKYGIQIKILMVNWSNRF